MMSHYIHLNQREHTIPNICRYIYIYIYTFQEENVDKAYGTKWGAIGTCWATNTSETRQTWLKAHVERTSHMHLPTNLVATKCRTYLQKLPLTFFLTYDTPHIAKKKASFKLK
jgi:hypothetical protein